MERRYDARRTNRPAERAKRKAANRSENGDKLREARLIFCMGIFAVAVCVKLFAPGVMDRVRDRGLELIGGSVDYKAAFHAVGQAIAGEKPVREAMAEVYEYAFKAGRSEAVEAEAETEEAQEEQETEDAAEPVIVTEQPKIRSLSDTREELPEDASMEKASVTFDYCPPVNGVLTSPFGWRDHPVDGVRRFHYGIDLGADSGTEIRAFAGGTVYAVGESATLGKYVMIDHPDGFRTIYGHCDEVYVSGGDEVKLGDTVAAVGSTGNATGSCLHFEMLVNGIHVDPEHYLTWA